MDATSAPACLPSLPPSQTADRLPDPRHRDPLVSSVRRYAIVRNAGTRQRAEAYLPDNYRVIHEFYEPSTSAMRAAFVIAGEDSAGWTLDAYVIPRYANGLIWCDEIDLSHPVMKQVPA